MSCMISMLNETHQHSMLDLLINPPVEKKNSPPKINNQNIKTEKLTENALKSFNSWSFKREQPDAIDLMRKRVGARVADAQPVSFVLYWGKGPRDVLADPDLQCLRFLSTMAQRIKDAHAPGAAIKLIFTDTHAELNGHSRQAALGYFDSVLNRATEFGFAGCLLGDLVAEATRTPGFAVSEQEPETDVLEKLHACARKWYGGEDSLQGAKTYYQANMVEKLAVELAFPDSIFVTFNGSEFRSLFPARMPIFYMYSTKRGCAVKPWFVAAPAETAEALTV